MSQLLAKPNHTSTLDEKDLTVLSISQAFTMAYYLQNNGGSTLYKFINSKPLGDDDIKALSKLVQYTWKGLSGKSEDLTDDDLKVILTNLSNSMQLI